MSASRAAWGRTAAGVFLAVLAMAWAAGDGTDASAATRPTPAPVARTRPVTPPPVVAPRVTSTEVCDGVLIVRFDAARLDGRQWVPLLDDGRARLELHDISGRSQGPDGAGTWYPRHTTSGGEHALRWARYRESQGDGAHWDAARVVVAGYVSPAVPISEECAA